MFLVLAGRQRSLAWDKGGARRVVVVEQQVVVVEQRWEKREAEGPCGGEGEEFGDQSEHELDRHACFFF